MVQEAVGRQTLNGLASGACYSFYGVADLPLRDPRRFSVTASTRSLFPFLIGPTALS